MGRPRTRSLTKAGVDHNEDIGEAEETEATPLIQQPKPNVQTRQNKLPPRQSIQQSEQSRSDKQSRAKKSASIGRPRKDQPKKRLSSISKLKHTKRKIGRPKQKSKLVQNIIEDNDDEDELDEVEDDDYNEVFDDDYYDEDEVMFEEVDDPRDKDYSPKDNYYIGNSSSRTSRGKNSAPDFHRTSVKSQSPVRPVIQNLIQGSSSSGSIPNLIDPSMIISRSPKVSLPPQNQLQYPYYAQNYSQGGNMNGSNLSRSRMVTPKPISPAERTMSQVNTSIPSSQNDAQLQHTPSIPTSRNDAQLQHTPSIPTSQNDAQLQHTPSIPTSRNDAQLQHTPSIPTSRNDAQLQHTPSIPTSRNDVQLQHHVHPEYSLTEFNRNSQAIQNESQRIPLRPNNNPSQTNHIPHRTENISSRNIQDQYPASYQPPSRNQEADAAESTQSTAHISEPQETGRTSCEICNSTGCTTQKTSTTITIKMTTVTEADQYGNMTTRTFVETDISPVTGTIESTEQTEITVETSEHPARSNVAPMTSPVGTDQNRPNGIPSPATPQEAEVQESEKNQNHGDQQHQMSQIPVSTSDPGSDPVFDPAFDPAYDSVYDPVFDPVFDPDHIPQNLPKLTAGPSSCSTPSQAARLGNSNIMQHNQALQSLLNTAQQNQLNLSSNASSLQSQRPRINRPILPAKPRPDRLMYNTESIVSPINPSNLVRNQTPNLETPVTSPQDISGISDISDGSPLTQKSQQDSNKKKTTTRKRSASKSTASPPSKRKNQKLLLSPSEPQIVISPYMVKAGNTFAGSNSSMQDITSPSLEPQQSSPYKPLTYSTVQSIPYFNSATPPRPPIFNTNDTSPTLANHIVNSTNTIPTITPPRKSRGTASTPHSNSTVQPSNSSTPQVGSSSNMGVIRDSLNNPFVVPRIGGSFSESTPIVHYNNNDRLISSGSSTNTISTNGGGVGYDSRGSSVANSIELLPPYYHISPIETIGSVTDVWNEWTAGINGNLSVIMMMEQYGGRWVYENEIQLKKRRVIVREVRVRSGQIGLYGALEELERLKGRNSLLWLVDRIRTRREQEESKSLPTFERVRKR